MNINNYFRNSETNLGSLEPERNILNHSSHLLVSNGFRSWFLKYFKLLDDDGTLSSQNFGFLRLASYLLSSPGQKDSDDPENHGAIHIGHKQLRELFKPGCRDNNFNATNALVDFQKRMWDLTIEPADYTLGRVARVTAQSLPKELSLRLRKELNLPFSQDFVDLVTGQPRSMSSITMPASSRIPEVESLRQQLNGLPSSTFDPVKQALQSAKEFVLKQEWLVNEMQRELVILRHCEADSKPIYKAVQNTHRLYTQGSSWLLLKRKTREQVTSSFWKLDLKAAQLKIAASLWNFDLSLYEAEGVWTYLLRSIGCKSSNKEMKNELKTFAYACLFGMTEKGLIKLSMKLKAPQLMKDPLIVSILAARRNVSNALLKGDTLTDAWGNKYKIEEKSKNKQKQVRSIMSAICQSYELKLLIPLINYAEKKGCTTVAVLHDCIFGIGDWGLIKGELDSLLTEEAKQVLGCKMELDVTEPAILARAA